MSKYLRHACAAASLSAALTFTACGRGADDAFTDATPEFDGVAMEISGDASEGISSSSLTQALTQDPSASPFLNYLRGARAGVKALNEATRKIVTPVAALAATDGVALERGTARMYGPKDDGNVTYRLFIKKVTEQRFTWRLDAKPKGGDDAAYKAILAGAMTKGELPHRGRGGLAADLDAYKVVDPTFPGQGKLLAGFAHVGDSKMLSYGLRNFSPDASTLAPISAAFVGHRLMPSRATGLRLVTYSDLAGTATTAKELVRTRIRYVPGVGGRADALATGGDIGQDTVVVGFACWNAQEDQGFSLTKACTRADRSLCIELNRVGALANCSREIATTEAAEPPSESVDDSAPEPGAPATDVTPPADVDRAQE